MFFFNENRIFAVFFTQKRNMLFLNKQKKTIRESLIFLTKTQKKKNKRIFDVPNKKNKKQTIRESLLFLTKKQKTKNNRIVAFLNTKKQKQNNKRIFAFLIKKT